MTKRILTFMRLFSTIAAMTAQSSPFSQKTGSDRRKILMEELIGDASNILDYLHQKSLSYFRMKGSLERTMPNMFFQCLIVIRVVW
ncbi:hypothetical protein Patl1_29419 [Pistacia atlantica]|uniref:Uncharacterized protein n=1 Tax=Pistacia atlantica TaxID=434234 RepID=A0ACC1AE88_9ROSI|nr:hypothetical protein Patl1_29419 [Pistacia atlantica]